MAMQTKNWKQLISSQSFESTFYKAINMPICQMAKPPPIMTAVSLRFYRILNSSYVICYFSGMLYVSALFSSSRNSFVSASTISSGLKILKNSLSGSAILAVMSFGLANSICTSSQFFCSVSTFVMLNIVLLRPSSLRSASTISASITSETGKVIPVDS